MPPPDAVAVLNKMGGKNTTAVHDTRFKARMSGMFSPQKGSDTRDSGQSTSRRSSGRLQQKKVASVGLRPGRRSSFSLPEHENTKKASGERTSKKRTGLKKKLDSKENDSPLKAQGFDMQLKENPKVNLHESPAKNTRSKNNNPLEALTRIELPIPKQWEGKTTTVPSNPVSGGTPGKNTTRKRSMNGELESEEYRRSAKRARVEDAHQTSRQEDGNEDKGQESGEEEQEQEEAEEAVNEQGNIEHDPQGAQSTSHQNSTQTITGVVDPQSRNERSSRSGSGGEASVAQAQPTKEAENARQQRAEVDEEEAIEFAKRTDRYVQDIGPAIRLKNCENDWGEAGGAALMIKARAAPKATEELESDRGKSVMRDIKRLKKAYRKRLEQTDQSSPSDIVPTTEIINSLNARRQLLEPTTNSRVNSSIIRDIYLHIIPDMMLLLKSFLRARSGDISFNEVELRELMRLLGIMIGICTTAQTWTPRPSTLERGVKGWVKNKIAPNVKSIEKKFEEEAARYDRMLADREASRKLAENQAFARQIIFEQINRAKLERIKRYRGIGFHDEQHESKGIDHLDEAPSAPQHVDHSDSYEQHSRPTSKTVSRPELHREATVDLPPPPAVDLSEDEKTALLNGLQIYVDEDRYSRILGDPELGDILRKRDLDDLVAAAKSYSGMMASKMGLEAYWADSSLEWLRSTDPDMRDNVSVVF